jgi:hypothetical protein
MWSQSIGKILILGVFSLLRLATGFLAADPISEKTPR